MSKKGFKRVLRCNATVSAKFDDDDDDGGCLVIDVAQTDGVHVHSAFTDRGKVKSDHVELTVLNQKTTTNTLRALADWMDAHKTYNAK